MILEIEEMERKVNEYTDSHWSSRQEWLDNFVAYIKISALKIMNYKAKIDLSAPLSEEIFEMLGVIVFLREARKILNSYQENRLPEISLNQELKELRDFVVHSHMAIHPDHYINE